MISKRIKISHKQSVLFYGPPIENVSLALENMSDDEDNGDCKTNTSGSSTADDSDYGDEIDEIEARIEETENNDEDDENEGFLDDDDGDDDDD